MPDEASFAAINVMGHLPLPLETVCRYENDKVIARFQDHFGIDHAEASSVFLDTKKWLWLCAMARIERGKSVEGVPEKLAIDSSLLVIDEMWHNFLCFTKDYREFCSANLGLFVDHHPTSREFNERLVADMGVSPSVQVERRRIQYRYIYDKLGEATFLRWYEYYATTYTEQRLMSLRRK